MQRREEGSDGEHARADREHLDDLARMRRRRAAKVSVALVLVLVLLVFVIRNQERVPVDFVFFTRQARLIWVMVTCAVVGGIAGFLLGRPGRRFRFHGKPEDSAEGSPEKPPKESPEGS
jgi:uncharacterized integral membrane protein